MRAWPKARFNNNSTGLAIAAAVIVLYLTLSVGSSLTKRPWCDEGWFASPGLNLATKGAMGTSVIEPYGWMAGIDQYTYWIMPLYPLTLAAWYKLFGFSLLSMRALSMLWGLVALGSWFLIVKKLSGDRKIALLTFALLALDYFFIMFASTGRMDMMSASLGFAGFASYLCLRERNLRLAVLASQSLIVASGLSHPYGILPFAGLLFLTLYFDRKQIRFEHAAIAAIPYLVGGLGWGLYILEEPSLFWAQFTGNINGTLGRDRWIGLTEPWTALKHELVIRYLGSYGFGTYSSGPARLKILVLLAYAIAVAGALFTPSIRRHRGYRALLMLTAVYFTILTLFEGSKVEMYIIHIAPLYTAILALWIRWCWTRRLLAGWAITAIVGGLLLLQLGGIVYQMTRNDYHKNYLPVASFLKQNAGRDSLVMGSAELGFQLGFDSNLVDDTRLGFYTGKTPDFVVVEKQYQGWIAMYSRTVPEMRDHFDRLLNERLQLIYESGEYQVYGPRKTDPSQFDHTAKR